MRLQLLASVVVGVALLPGWAQAQIKLPIYEEDTGVLSKVVFEEASQRGDFRHGKLLRVTLNGSGEKTVKGILVRVDKQKGRIYLRTEPGAMPIAFAEKDIKRIDKGVIKEVSYAKDYAQPEIQPVVFLNGSRRTISYNAPTLSPGEKSYLLRMEAVENEMGRLESLAERQEQVLETDIAIQAEHRRTQELINSMLWKYNEPFAWRNKALPWGHQLLMSLPTAVRQGPTVFPSLPVAPRPWPRPARTTPWCVAAASTKATGSSPWFLMSRRSNGMSRARKEALPYGRGSVGSQFCS